MYALAFAGTNLFIGGEFDTVNGAAGYNNMARWNGSTWSRMGYYGGYGVNNPVMAVTAIGNVVYFGGDFTKAGGGSVNYFAKCDGSNWSGVGGGLDYWVTALANDGTNLYVGGMFTNAGPTNASCIAKWNGTAWSPLGSGLDIYPNALAVSGNDLYAGCNSTNAGGKPSCYIARWSPAAALVAPWITSVGFSSGDAVVSFTTRSGQIYDVLGKNQLEQTAWASITNGVSGSGSTESVADPGAAALPQRFYRVITHK